MEIKQEESLIPMKNKNNGMSFLGKFIHMREFMILMVVVFACILLSIASPIFLTKTNILAVLLGLSVNVIVAIGMTNLMVSGGFDLSVGSTVAMTGGFAALAMASGLPAWIAIIIGLLTGFIIGLANGLIIAKIGINPFITTLGMMSVVRGMLMVIVKGKTIIGFPPSFTIIGQGKILGIQYPIIIAIIMVVIGDILLRRSRFFRQNYYIGGNERAAILSGINVDNMKIFNYTLIGVLSAIAGLIMTSRLAAASVTAGTGLELQVISATIIGGASLSGGEGTVSGAFLGALLMALITNALNLLGVDVYWNSLVIGSVLIIAVMIDVLGKKKQGLS